MLVKLFADGSRQVVWIDAKVIWAREYDGQASRLLPIRRADASGATRVLSTIINKRIE